MRPVTNLQLLNLNRFRRYQRLLVFGGGTLTTVMVLMMFLVEARMTLLRHVESLRQAFNAEQAVLLKEINAREDSFRVAMEGAETIWREGVPLDTSHANHYRTQGRQILLGTSSELRPQWVFGTGNGGVGDTDLGRFFSLALQVGRATSVDRLVKGDVLSSYFYSLRHSIVGIVPAPEREAREQIIGDRERFLRLLTRDVDQRIFWSSEGVVNDHEKPLLWFAPYSNPYTGEIVLRIAGPILDRGTPIAALVMEYSLPRLSQSFLPDGARGAYTILSERGEVISATESEYYRLRDFDRSSRAGLLLLEKDERVELYQDGVLTIADGLGETGWLLVFHYSWRDFVSVLGWQIGLKGLMALGTVTLIWGWLLYFKLRIFRPLIKRSFQVFESEQLSRTLIETAPVGIGLLDVGSGEPLLQSLTMIQMQARARLGLSSVMLDHYQRHCLKVLGPRSTRLMQEDLSIETIDGQQVSLSLSAAPIRYRGRDALVVAFTDITEKKHLEQHLLEARDAAEKANAAKSSFLAAMSHEIRTPLNAILGNLELLAHTAEESQRDRLATIRHASDSLLAIVSDVLDFSKIEAGELSLECIEFDVLEVASGALSIFAPIAQAKGLQLLGELGDSITRPMQGDPTRLGQVLNNLLSNAIKFTEQGQVTLRIATDLGADQIHLEVEDTGIGMSAEQIQRALHAFSQADATINRRYGGTGLGLTLCLRLAEAMNGELTVNSVPGRGSLLRLSLPLGGCKSVALHPAFDGERVLVLASLPACRAYLDGVLQSWGLRSEAFQHPAQLSEAALAEADALVLWGERSTWHVDDENRLIEEATWVIDCSSEGPSEPVVSGRLLSTSVYGPRGLALALCHALQAKPLPIRKLTPPALQVRLRVLVAEDNPINRRLFEEQLQLLGCETQLAEDGAQALACLERDAFDVLLTDLSMPVLDGYALARHARQRWPEMPIVAATASVTLQERERCRIAGIARVVSKPMSLSVLERVLSELCGVAERAPANNSACEGDLLGGRDLPEELMQTFRRFCSETFMRIHQAQVDGDQNSLLHELHALKGALGVYRYPEASMQIAEIEGRLKAGEFPAIEHLKVVLRTLEDELERRTGFLS